MVTETAVATSNPFPQARRNVRLARSIDHALKIARHHPLRAEGMLQEALLDRVTITRLLTGRGGRRNVAGTRPVPR